MKERMKGLILGAALTAAAFGLTFTAAADRTIRVEDDDIGVKINKAAFTIRDTSGIQVQPFCIQGHDLCTHAGVLRSAGTGGRLRQGHQYSAHHLG